MTNKIFSNKTIAIFLLVMILITSCSSLTRFISSSKDLQIDSRDSKPRIELFVMSQCPYAIEAEKGIIPLIKELKDRVDFNLYFIAEENDGNGQEKSSQVAIKTSEEIEGQQMDQCQGEATSEGGKFKSLHGKSEIDEDIRQVVITKYYPDKYLDYLLLRSENYASDKWEECAARAWIDCEFISQIAQSEEGDRLFSQNIKRAHELRINASPALLINGKRYKGQITRFGLSRKVCQEGPAHEFCESIPVCGTDSDCLAKGKVGVCVDPEKPQATCKFSEPIMFILTVIKTNDCPVCNLKQLLEMMKDLFPGVEIKELENNTDEAKKLINDLNIKVLPAFYFDSRVVQTARYSRIKDSLLEIKDGYLLDSKYLNISYLLGREEKREDIKLFVESMSPETIATEDFFIKDGFFKKEHINIHYIARKVNTEGKKEVELLALKQDGNNPGVLHLDSWEEKVIFESPKGLKEIQENLRQLCISKYYPDQYLDYLSCINKDLVRYERNLDWRQCLLKDKTDHQKIDSCTNGKEGMNLLLNDIALVEEVGVFFCPTYLINNRILVKGIDPIGFKKIYYELIHEP